MDGEIIDYLTLETVVPRNEIPVEPEKPATETISTLQQVKDRLQNDTQRSVMEKIIRSAEENVQEVPKVVNHLEAPNIFEKPKQEVPQVEPEVKTIEVVELNEKKPFVRKTINFSALDELYLEEAQNFVKKYREEHPIKEEYPKRVDEAFVEEVLSMPLQNEIRPTAICAVPFLEMQSLGMPEDKVISALNAELSEDALFSFITMNHYDSELGDFVYTEATVGVVSSDLLDF